MKEKKMKIFCYFSMLFFCIYLLAPVTLNASTGENFVEKKDSILFIKKTYTSFLNGTNSILNTYTNGVNKTGKTVNLATTQTAGFFSNTFCNVKELFGGNCLEEKESTEDNKKETASNTVVKKETQSTNIVNKNIQEVNLNTNTDTRNETRYTNNTDSFSKAETLSLIALLKQELLSLIPSQQVIVERESRARNFIVNTDRALTEGTTDFSGSTITTTGNGTIGGSLNVTGNVTANAFIGDGSLLTGVDSLPTQTGNSGKYLTTDGTDASWIAIPISPTVTEVFGSLNSGYLPNYDGTDFANSPIYTNGTDVGIGKTNPDYALDITGDFRISGQIYDSIGANSIDPNVRRLKAANSSTSVDYANRNLSDGVVGTLLSWSNPTVIVNPATASDVGFIVRGKSSQTGNLQEWQNSSGTVMGSITSSGTRLNLGTTSVGGTINFGSPNTHDFFTLNGGNPLISRATSKINWASGSYWSSQGFYTGGTERMTIDSDGNVGIGVTSPSSKLHVVGNNATTGLDFIALFTEPGVTTEAGATVGVAADRSVMVQGNGGAFYLGRDVTNDIEFGMGTSQLGESFAGSLTNHGFSLRTNNTNRLTIDNSGNVGIGIADPSAPLHVNYDGSALYFGTGGNVDSYMTFGGRGFIGYDNPGVVDGYLTFQGTTGKSVALKVGSPTFGSGTLGLFVNGSSSNGTIGNVGIATTAPDKLLTIQQKADNDGLRVYGYDDHSSKYLDFHVYSNGRGYISSNNSIVYNASANNYFVAGGSTYFDLANDTSKLYVRDTEYNNVAYIDEDGGAWFDGNVGVGITSPSAKLHVLGTAEQLRIGYDASNYTSFTTDSVGNLTIDPTGTSIIAPSGTLSGTDKAGLAVGSIGSGFVFTGDAGGQGLYMGIRDEIESSYFAVLNNDASGGDRIFKTYSSNGNSQFLVDLGSGGNVQSGQLSFTGAGTNMKIRPGITSSWSAVRSLALGTTQDGLTATANTDWDDVVIARDLDGGSSYSEAGANLRLYRDVTNVTATNGNFLEWANSSGTLGVIDSSGNVGIGTTTPSAKLTVDGEGVFGSGLYVNNTGNQYANMYIGPSSDASGAYAGIWMGSNASTHTVSNYSFLSNGTHSFFNAPAGYDIYFRINNNNKMVVNDDGNVGIGIDVPTEKLDIRDGANYIKLNVDSEPSLVSSGNFSIKKGSSNMLRVINGWTGTWSDSVSTSYFQVGDTGNTIFSGVSGSRFNRLAYTSNAFQFTNGTGSITPPTKFFQIDYGDDIKFYVETDGDGYFQGNVGIGTTSPSAKLHIDDSTSGVYTSASGIKIQNSSAVNPNYITDIYNATDYANPSVSATYIVPSANSSRLFFGRSGYSWYALDMAYVQNITNPPNIQFAKGKYLSWGDTNNQIIVDGSNQMFFKTYNNSFIWYRTQTSTEQMRLDGTGLGIGTNSPSAKLQINTGAADVKGLIVKGASSQSANLAEWQDSDGAIIARINKSEMPFEVYANQEVTADNLIPTMTSATTPSGVVSASSQLNTENYAAWYAFAYNLPNGNSQTWVANTNSGWLRYQFPTAQTIVRYDITNRNEVNPRAPNAWTFEGSNDGTNWTVLDTQSGITSWNSTGGTTLSFTFSNNTAYTYYRINISPKAGDSYIGIGRLKMYESVDGTVYASAFSVTDEGYIGIGTNAPAEKLTVNGNAKFESVTSGTYAFDLNLTSDGTLTTSSSDERLKKNINTLDSISTLDKILQLRSVEFDWELNSNHDIGLIAQEVEEIFPELVFENPTDGYKGINYSRIPVLLISAIQELSRKVMSLFDGTGQVKVKEICVGEICVTEEEFAKVFSNNQSANVSESNSENDGPQNDGQVVEVGDSYTENEDGEIEEIDPITGENLDTEEDTIEEVEESFDDNQDETEVSESEEPTNEETIEEEVIEPQTEEVVEEAAQ